MRNFDLYVSGILYGRLRLGDGTPQIRKLDVHTGALLDWQDLTEQDRDFYRFFVKMDFAALGQNLSHYESGLHGTGEVSLCGERYTSEDGCSYLQRDVKFPNNKQMKDGRLIAVTCPAREMVTVLVEPGAEEETILRLWRSTWPEEQLFPVEHAQTFPVPMRDGVHLSTIVYLPKNCSTPVPAVLVRTPYGKEDGCEIYYRYVQRGYAVVVQDVRGRNASEGEWLPNYHEVEDGDDTLNWIAAQPWCSGRIGMVGGSYLGYVQWAAAASGNPVTRFMLLSLALTALLLALRGGIVSIMSTPEEAVQGTLAYLTVCFIGIPFITAYNIIASIFRGLGDSKSPKYFIAVACVVNIALDYYFMGTLHLGPAGAALGATLSQAVSVLVSLAVILKRRLISIRRADFRPQRAVMGKLLQIGVPVALQDGFIQVSFVIITIIANRRGLTDAAAVGIVEKIIGFLFLIPSSMLSTVSALGAQNIGAGKPERARLTLRYAAIIACSFGIAVVVLTLFIAEPLVGLFTPDAAVTAAGGQYLRGYIWDSFFAGVQFSFSGYFCACGKSGISFLHYSLSILLVRVPGAYLASNYFPLTLLPMGLANAAGSLFSILVCVIAYAILTRREKRAQEAS